MFEEYSFVFDIDGTLCPIKKKEEKYEDIVPYFNMIEKLRYYKENGAKIMAPRYFVWVKHKIIPDMKR